MTFIEDCPITNGSESSVCTVVEKKVATTVLTVVTVTQIPSQSVPPTATVAISASTTPKNGAGRVRLGALGASVLVGVVAGLVLAGAVV